MTEFYCARAATVKLASGAPFKLHRGVHPVPDEIANSAQANVLGIKPVEEMTDDEWRLTGGVKPAPEENKSRGAAGLEDGDAK